MGCTAQSGRRAESRLHAKQARGRVAFPPINGHSSLHCHAVVIEQSHSSYLKVDEEDDDAEVHEGMGRRDQVRLLVEHEDDRSHYAGLSRAVTPERRMSTSQCVMWRGKSGKRGRGAEKTCCWLSYVQAGLHELHGGGRPDSSNKSL